MLATSPRRTNQKVTVMPEELSSIMSTNACRLVSVLQFMMIGILITVYFNEELAHDFHVLLEIPMEPKYQMGPV